MAEPTVVHTWREHGRRCVAFGDDPTISAVLRRVVPPSYRRYDAARDVWEIRGVYWLSLYETLCTELGAARVHEHETWAAFAGVRDGERTRFDRLPRPDAYETLFVLPSAPREVVEAAYRALAKTYHPDRGGNGARMRRLNVARAAILGAG